MKIECFINRKMWIAWVLLLTLCNPLIAQNMENELTKRQQSIIPILNFYSQRRYEKFKYSLE